MIRFFLVLPLIFVSTCTSGIATESKPDDWDELKTSSNLSFSPTERVLDLSDKFLGDDDYKMLEEGQYSGAKLANVKISELEKLATVSSLPAIDLKLKYLNVPENTTQSFQVSQPQSANQTDLSFDMDDTYGEDIWVAANVKLPPHLEKHRNECKDCSKKPFMGIYLTHLSDERISSLLTKFSKLDLSYCEIGDQEAITLASILRKMTSLTSINVSHNTISDKGVKSLADVLLNSTSITSFDVSDNNLSDEGVNSLADAILSGAPALKQLTFSYSSAKNDIDMMANLDLNSLLGSMQLAGNEISSMFSNSEKNKNDNVGDIINSIKNKRPSLTIIHHNK